MPPPPPPAPPLHARNRSLTHTPLSPHSLSPPPPSQQHHSHDQPGRSRNARAQARHRAKRKAYIEQLEETVTKLQNALSLTPEQALALPAVHANAARLRVLEADYDVLREYAECLRDLCLRAGVPSPPPLPLPTPAPAPSPLAMHPPPMLSLASAAAPSPAPPSAQALGPAPRTFSQTVPYLSTHHAHSAYRPEHMNGSPGPTGKRRRHSGSASGETDASGVYLTPPNGTPPLNGAINARPPPLTLPTHSPHASSQPQSAHPHSAHSSHPTPPLPLSAKWDRTDESPASAGAYTPQGAYMHNAMYAADAHDAGTGQPSQTANGPGTGTGGGAMSTMPPPMPVRHASASADLHLPPLVPSLAQHRQAYAGYAGGGTGHALAHGHGYAEHAHAHHGHGGRTGYDMELVKREDNADDFERARAAHHGVGGNSMHSMSPTTATGAVVGFSSLHQQQQQQQRPPLASLHQQPQHQQHQQQHQHQPQHHQQQHQQYQQQQQSPHSPYSPVGQQLPYRTGAAGSGLAHYEDGVRAAHHQQHQQHQHQQQQHQVPTFQNHGSTGSGSGSGSGTSQSQWSAAPPPPSSSSVQAQVATGVTTPGAGPGAVYHR